MSSELNVRSSTLGLALTSADELDQRTRVLHSFDPPAGLSAVATNPGNGSGPSQTATIQSHLDYVHTQWGGGVVDIGHGGGEIFCGGTTGLAIPAGVQLRSDLKTKIYFSQLTTGAAIYVSDSDFAPITNLWLQGANNPAQSYPTNPSVGIHVVGVGLRFTHLKIEYFGIGVHLANSNTYIHSYDGVTIGNCGTCVYNDGEAFSLTENGERIVFTNFTFHDSLLAVHATGNNLDLHLIGGSIDYCSEFGRVSNSWLYLTDCHLETAGISTPVYLFDVQNNSHVQMSNTDIIMGGRTHLFNQGHGPSNYAFGVARFSGVNCFYIDSNSNSITHFSTHMVSWVAGTTTMTIPVPWPLRWCTVATDFVATDTATVPNNDKPLISGINSVTASITVTSPSNAADRWLRLVFG